MSNDEPFDDKVIGGDDFPDPPLRALFDGARGDNEHAALHLLEWAPMWLHRKEVAQHITVTVDDCYPDDERAWAVMDWPQVAQTLDDHETATVAQDRDAAILAVACSLACGHKIDLRRVARSLRRSDDAAAVAYAILYAGRHHDHIVRWPEVSRLPNYARIVDTRGRVQQEAGHRHQPQWYELGYFGKRAPHERS